VTFAAVTAPPGLPEPTADLALPGLTASPALPELMVLLAPREPTALPALRALMVSQAQMAPLVDAASPERRGLKARPAPRARKALRVDPETGNVSVRDQVTGPDIDFVESFPKNKGENKCKIAQPIRSKASFMS
jgi:hypothetical protein